MHDNSDPLCQVQASAWIRCEHRGLRTRRSCPLPGRTTQDAPACNHAPASLIIPWRACSIWSGMLRAVWNVRGSDAIKGAQALACPRRCSCRSLKANLTFQSSRSSCSHAAAGRKEDGRGHTSPANVTKHLERGTDTSTCHSHNAPPSFSAHAPLSTMQRTARSRAPRLRQCRPWPARPWAPPRRRPPPTCRGQCRRPAPTAGARLGPARPPDRPLRPCGTDQVRDALARPGPRACPRTAAAQRRGMRRAPAPRCSSAPRLAGEAAGKRGRRPRSHGAQGRPPRTRRHAWSRVPTDGWSRRMLPRRAPWRSCGATCGATLTSAPPTGASLRHEGS